jgi:hypothetical protein
MRNYGEVSAQIRNSEYLVMRVWIAFAILLMTTPVYAQTAGSSSGASAVINNTTDAPSPDTRVTAAPTVVAPGLAAAGVETCLGSASGGIAVMGGGFTFGSTMVDEGCTIRLLARQLFNFGLHKAAVALMCQDERVMAAMEAAGTPCPRLFAEVEGPNRVAAISEQPVRHNGVD